MRRVVRDIVGRTRPVSALGPMAAAMLLAGAPALASGVDGRAAELTGTSAGRPDIITIYLDDVDPHDGRLWSDPRRTPHLARLFADSGVAFRHAVVETPLCSPGRAGLLTGRHTANHGVDGNEVGAFDPGVTIGTELQDAGYRTLYMGKYLNGLRSEVPPAEVERYASGWDAFDVIYQDNGRYLDYDLWTRDGIESGFRRPSAHATLETQRRTVEHLRASDPDTPVFAMVSLFELHAPNRPLERYRGDPRCQKIGRWRPPSFNADVTGKPSFIRERRPIARKGWPMRTLCQQLLGVDAVVGALLREQQRRGRADDTLFILTADNGVTWGTHRLPQRKGNPYATPVPLVFSWPARWGEEPRAIDELVSNIDVAPTLCAIAGCEMGPFADGSSAADGLSLLPLLDGEVERLPRTVVREQSGPDYPWTPEFWAVRTSDQHPLGRWHYIEWETGEVELYDSAADPWELVNLAADPAARETTTALAAELRRHFPRLPTLPVAARVEPVAG